MTRAVLDTNVVLSAVLSPDGRPGRVVALAGRRFQLVWTPAIVAECYGLLAGRKFARLLRGAEAAARALVASLAAGAEMVPPELLPDVRVVPSDPDDDVLFAAALAGGADRIVTGDRAVLAAGGYGGVLAVSAAGFLASLGEP